MEFLQVLVVDDSTLWRDFVLRYFETKTGFKIIGVAVNGLEAVQKVDQLRPDVILMYINLPGINGIEATRQICNTFPGSKIVFVSMLDDPAIVRAAFDVGGSATFSNTISHRIFFLASGLFSMVDSFSAQLNPR